MTFRISVAIPCSSGLSAYSFALSAGLRCGYRGAMGDGGESVLSGSDSSQRSASRSSLPPSQSNVSRPYKARLSSSMASARVEFTRLAMAPRLAGGCCCQRFFASCSNAILLAPASLARQARLSERSASCGLSGLLESDRGSGRCR